MTKRISFPWLDLTKLRSLDRRGMFHFSAIKYSLVIIEQYQLENDHMFFATNFFVLTLT